MATDGHYYCVWCLEDVLSRQYLCTHHDHGTISVDDEREEGGGDWRKLYPNNALAYIKVSRFY